MGDATNATVCNPVNDPLDYYSTGPQVKFVPCDCYDDMLQSASLGHMSSAMISCPLYDSYELVNVATVTSKEYDICIVSAVAVGSDSSTGQSEWRIDLSKPLPNPLLLFHDSPSNYVPFLYYQNSTKEYPADWMYFPYLTLFDTSCSYQSSRDGVLPLFPGYGKYPDTCADNGFIDLKWKYGPHFGQEHAHLPPTIPHYSNAPPAEMFWYEFMDGTSAAFWPNSWNDNNLMYFRPSFATCSCIDCPSEAPSQAPISSIEPAPAPAPTCNPESFAACYDFAKSACVTNGADGSPAGISCEYNPMRLSSSTSTIGARRNKIRALEELIGLVVKSKQDGSGTDYAKIFSPDHRLPSHIAYELNVDEGNVVTRDWVTVQRDFHLKRSRFLKEMKVKH